MGVCDNCGDSSGNVLRFKIIRANANVFVRFFYNGERLTLDVKGDHSSDEDVKSLINDVIDQWVDCGCSLRAVAKSLDGADQVKTSILKKFKEDLDNY